MLEEIQRGYYGFPKAGKFKIHREKVAEDVTPDM